MVPKAKVINDRLDCGASHPHWLGKISNDPLTEKLKNHLKLKMLYVLPVELDRN